MFKSFNRTCTLQKLEIIRKLFQTKLYILGICSSSSKDLMFKWNILHLSMIFFLAINCNEQTLHNKNAFYKSLSRNVAKDFPLNL